MEEKGGDRKGVEGNGREGKGGREGEGRGGRKRGRTRVPLTQIPGSVPVRKTTAKHALKRSSVQSVIFSKTERDREMEDIFLPVVKVLLDARKNSSFTFSY